MLQQTRVLRSLSVLAALLLASCGGGSESGSGGGGGGGGGVTAPSGLSYPTAPAFVVGQAITPLTPTVTGQVTSYSVDQTLPAGLSLSSTSGVISGTPTAVTAAANYTVHAQNSAGSTSATVTITVTPAPCTGQVTSGLSNFAYPHPPIYAVGVPIPPLTPTILGECITYSMVEPLPAGLALDASSGVISGTPTAAAAQARYTVRAQNTLGNALADVTITVASGSSLGYSSPKYGFTANVPGTITPQPAGLFASGNPTWSVTPALPAGLTLNPGNGTISGTATAASPASSYTVTAAYSGGMGTATLTITVVAAPLLDLGLTDRVVLIHPTATRVLSLDARGHWVLQDFTSGNVLAHGSGACSDEACIPDQVGKFAQLPVDLAGNVMIDSVPGGVEVRSVTDGHILGSISGTFAWFALASDGNYVSTGSPTALVAWSTTGSVLFSQPGDYSHAAAFAAPGQVRVALGPAGANIIETVTVPAGASSSGPAFQGQFRTWFRDGGNFLSSLGNVVWTYSAASVQQDLTSLSSSGVGSLNGWGQYFWNLPTPAILGGSVYKVGNSSSPAATDLRNPIIPSGSTLGTIFRSSTLPIYQLTVVDLSGPAPVSTAYNNVPSPHPDGPLAYGSISSTQWLTGDSFGVILDGSSPAAQPRYITLGQAVSIAGGTSYFSVATASGKILNFNSATNAPIGSISLLSALLASSSDGTVLAAMPDSYGEDARPGRPATSQPGGVFSLPSGSKLMDLTSDYPYQATGVVLSGSGNVIGLRISSGWNTLPVGGGNTLYSDTGGTQALQLSPDGTLTAVTTGAGAGYGTSIYNNGALKTAVQGLAVGWLDNGRLLTQIFGGTAITSPYASSAIYDPTGKLLTTPPLPKLPFYPPVSGGAQQMAPWMDSTADADAIYAPVLNEILSLTTGQQTWASGNAASGVGAVAGRQIVFVSDTQVLAQPY